VSTPRATQGHTLMVVDDHPLMRVGIVSIINSQHDLSVVAQASTEDEAVRQFGESRPDLTVMDLRLAKGSGLGAIRRIISIQRNASILVLTTYEGDEDIHQALSAGARGYLLKDLSHQELLRAIRQILGGRTFIPTTVNTTLSSRSRTTTLTSREHEVLRFLFRGLNNREIAVELRIGEATVKTHVGVILAKLGVNDRTSAVVEALKRGLLHLEIR
jgi:DNA-binding NarL/FixJ family response regulator